MLRRIRKTSSCRHLLWLLLVYLNNFSSMNYCLRPRYETVSRTLWWKIRLNVSPVRIRLIAVLNMLHEFEKQYSLLPFHYDFLILPIYFTIGTSIFCSVKRRIENFGCYEAGKAPDFYYTIHNAIRHTVWEHEVWRTLRILPSSAICYTLQFWIVL